MAPIWHRAATYPAPQTNVLSITAATTNNAGNYSLVVTNSFGSVTSSVAVLAVGFAPVFSTQPTNLVAFSGSYAVFSATISGSTPIAFQWGKNGINLVDGPGISGSASNVLTLVAITTASSGNYNLTVTNGFGAATSSVATLAVILPSPDVALVSSENPSGFRDSLNFTASLAPSGATGTIQFWTNGAAFDVEPLVAGLAVSTNLAALPRGTNVIAAVYSGDANNLSATNSLTQIVTNHPPSATAVFYERLAGYPLDIAIADLATNWTDADGDALSLAAIGISTNGVTVTNNTGMLLYFDTNNVDDQFVCTISDGWGGTNLQAVSIEMVLTNAMPAIIRRRKRVEWQRDVEPRRRARRHLYFGDGDEPVFTVRLAAARHEYHGHQWRMAVHGFRSDEQPEPLLPASTDEMTERRNPLSNFKLPQARSEYPRSDSCPMCRKNAK